MIDSAGNKIPVESEGFLKETTVLSADTTLTVKDSGKTFILDAIGEVITLPAVTDGVNYRFIVNAVTATTDWTIVAATNVIQGSAIVAGAVVAADDENTISLVATKTLLGDYVEIESDGTNWYVRGNAVTSAAITFTAP